ncbi:MAG TPA: hypothetical protein PKI41_03480 [Candidatus Competibacteraceae bacterium]|nr:hypothetical protein [Candidatus Competibacteraceae bacterium]HQA24762.1 hypothetical protein [Candidatus Competibacteraceae bacterium]HQD55484.1 hypothetical protein [Candidatus Competibacteraceae bacterium]
MQSIDHDLEAQLQKMMAEQAKKQSQVENTLREYGLERSHLQAYIEKAKANTMVQSIVSIKNYINNHLNVGTER